MLFPYIRDVLTRLQDGGFPEALVAGGALRDWDNDHEFEIKDIDIFIKDRTGYLTALIDSLPGFWYRLAVPVHVAQYMQFEGVVAVHEFVNIANPDLPPIQVCVMKMDRSTDPMVIIQRHDFGICQIGYDGDTLYTTPDYDKDHMNGTFTLVRCRDEKDLTRSLKRWARLSQKYTNWRLELNDHSPI